VTARAPAAPALLLRRRSTREAVALDPSLELGSGGEARVFALPGDRTMVAKIYHQPTVERARKLARASAVERVGPAPKLGVLVMEGGTVGRSFVMVHPTSQELSERVAPAAEAMVFRPLTSEGEPVRTWVWIQPSFEP
jgi:hypothetical protein